MSYMKVSGGVQGVSGGLREIERCFRFQGSFSDVLERFQSDSWGFNVVSGNRNKPVFIYIYPFIFFYEAVLMSHFLNICFYNYCTHIP